MTPTESHPHLGRNPDAATESKAEPVAETSYFVFDLADSMYAVEAEKVQFIAPSVRPLPVPTAPQYLMGIVHIRGRVITVVDIKLLLGLSYEAPEQSQMNRLDQRLVVLQSQAKPFAVIADRALGLFPVREDRIERFEQNESASDETDELLEGSFEQDRAVVSILNPEKMLSVLIRRSVQSGGV